MCVCVRARVHVCVHVYIIIIIVTYNVYVSGTQVTSDSLGDLGPRILRGTYYIYMIEWLDVVSKYLLLGGKTIESLYDSRKFDALIRNVNFIFTVPIFCSYMYVIPYSRKYWCGTKFSGWQNCVSPNIFSANI